MLIQWLCKFTTIISILLLTIVRSLTVLIISTLLTDWNGQWYSSVGIHCWGPGNWWKAPILFLPNPGPATPLTSIAWHPLADLSIHSRLNHSHPTISFSTPDAMVNSVECKSQMWEIRRFVPGCVKPMTYKNWHLLLPGLVLSVNRIGQQLVGSIMSGKCDWVGYRVMVLTAFLSSKVLS